MPVGDVWSETDTQSSKCAARAHIMLCMAVRDYVYTARTLYKSLYTVHVGLAPGRRDDDMRHAETKEKSDTICGAAGRARPPCRPPQRGRSAAWGSYSYTLYDASRYSAQRPAARRIRSIHAQGPRASLPTRLTQRGRGMGEHLFWIHTHYIYLSLSASWRRKKAAVCVERRAKNAPRAASGGLLARAYGRREKGL